MKCCLPHFGLDGYHSVDFSWKVGGTAKDFSRLHTLRGVFGGVHYDLVIIVAGGNDLSYHSPEQVAKDYTEVIEKLRSDYCYYVIFSQVMPRERPRFMSEGEFCGKATELNTLMAMSMRGQVRGKFWKNRGLWNAQQILVLPDGVDILWPTGIFRDGVHLNGDGMRRLYFSLRHAIGWFISNA